MIKIRRTAINRAYQCDVEIKKFSIDYLSIRVYNFEIPAGESIINVRSLFNIFRNEKFFMASSTLTTSLMFSTIVELTSSYRNLHKIQQRTRELSYYIQLNIRKLIGFYASLYTV